MSAKKTFLSNKKSPAVEISRQAINITPLGCMFRIFTIPQQLEIFDASSDPNCGFFAQYYLTAANA